MKKIYSLLILSATVVSAFGQARISGTMNPVSVEAGTVVKRSNPSILVIDTMDTPVFSMACFTGDVAPFVFYNLGSAGYLAGNSSYGQTEVAQRYSFTGNGTISEVLIWYAVAKAANGTTSAKVYSINATTKTPQTALGTSPVVLTGSILTTGYTSYTFSPAVSVTADFAVASVLPTTIAAGDTACIVSTKLSCFSPDSSSYLNIPAFGGWNEIKALVNTPPTPQDSSIDLMIKPVIDITTGINSYPSSNGLTLKGAYPNPATTFTSIRFATQSVSDVSLQVFDLSGKVIEAKTEKFSAGNHEWKISLKDIAEGNYYYTITTGEAQLTSKFVVTK